MYKNDMTVSVVNFTPVWGNKIKNIEKMYEYIEKAAENKANIVIFPETALIGYDNEVGVPREKKMHILNAETVPGESTEKISALAKKYNMCIIFGLAEKDKLDSNVIYNSAAICAPDGEIFSYKKIHLPLDESDWAMCGEIPMVFETKWGPIGLAICYDTYCYPELIRYARAKGARLFINCTACSDGIDSVMPLKMQLESSSLTNRIYIASADLCGTSHIDHFIGGSSIIGVDKDSPKEAFYYAGKAFDEKDADKEEMYTATLDLEFMDNGFIVPMFTHNSRVGHPDFRPEVYSKMYGDLSESLEWKKMID